jgi:hypothetical protein
MAKSLISPKISRSPTIDLNQVAKSMTKRPLIWKNTVPRRVYARARLPFAEPANPPLSATTRH